MLAEHLTKGYKRAISRAIDRLDDRWTEEGQRELDWLLGMHDHWHAVWKNS